MEDLSNTNTTLHQSVPPGFRFHPTDEELVDYYLRRKINAIRIDLDVIKEIDLYKVEPWDLNELCGTGMEETDEWYFFSYKDKKYPTGTRTNRATAMGFWKATGRDKAIYNSVKKELIGLRKTLVYYQGRAPNGQKSDWIMHEYRLESEVDGAGNNFSQEEGWVVCRVFRKRMAATARRLQAINELEPPSQHFWSTLQHNHPSSFTGGSSSASRQNQQLIMNSGAASLSDYQFLLQTATGCSSSEMIKHELLEQLPNLSNQFCHEQSPFPSLVQNPSGLQIGDPQSDDYGGSGGWPATDSNSNISYDHHQRRNSAGFTNPNHHQRKMSRKQQRLATAHQHQQFTTAAGSPMLMQEEDNNNFIDSCNDLDTDEQMTDWRVLDKLVASQLSPPDDDYDDSSAAAAFESTDDCQS